MKGDRPAAVMFYTASALVFLFSTGATVYLCHSMSGGMPMPGGWVMSMAWMRMPGQSWPASAASFIGMWLVMMAAMMMASLTLMLSGFRRSDGGHQETQFNRLTVWSGAGYFSVWAAAGAAVYPLGIAVGEAAMRWPALARSVPLATGVILVLAGCVQFTTWKTRWLVSCRAEPGGDEPLSHDAWSACRHGLALGVRCLRCCGNLMVILLVTGVMDLRAMALVTGAITIERVVRWPRVAARLTGVAVMAAGILVIGLALVHHP